MMKKHILITIIVMFSLLVLSGCTSFNSNLQKEFISVISTDNIPSNITGIMVLYDKNSNISLINVTEIESELYQSYGLNITPIRIIKLGNSIIIVTSDNITRFQSILEKDFTKYIFSNKIIYGSSDNRVYIVESDNNNQTYVILEINQKNNQE